MLEATPPGYSNALRVQRLGELVKLSFLLSYKEVGPEQTIREVVLPTATVVMPHSLMPSVVEMILGASNEPPVDFGKRN